MISMQTSQLYSPIDLDPGFHGYRERCQRQVAEAEKEMGAFVIAVGRTSGPAAAARAAEYWIELAEAVIPLPADDSPNWRQLTIMAASRLAVETGRRDAR